jgi:hypothetical protein
MSTVKWIPWTNRLGKLLRQPGGITAGHALRKAAENLESIRETSLSALDEYMARIETLRREAGPEASEEVKQKIYRLANDIHGVAGVFGLGQLGEAAFSLCELLDRLHEHGRWSPEAVDVHLAALRLLRHHHEEVDSAAVLAGLHRITERERRPEPGPS